MGSFILDQNQEVIAAAVRPGDLAVDATMGNGWDTALLARLVGPTGRVIALDIQPSAIQSTRARLEAQGLMDRCVLCLRSHAELAATVGALSEQPPSAVMFNLGYLPGGDKTITTNSASTLASLQDALRILAQGGVITVVAYRGHSGAEEECDAVEAWIHRLDRRYFDTERVTDPSGPGHAPRLFVVRKHSVV